MCGVTRFQLKKPEDLSGEVRVQRQSLKAERQLPEARGRGSLWAALRKRCPGVEWTLHDLRWA